ncbi:MAG: rod shape-determining protein MreC [Bacteroidia bacterium]
MILRLFRQWHAFFSFFIIETAALILYLTQNARPKNQFSHLVHATQARIGNLLYYVTAYYNLPHRLRALHEENARLRFALQEKIPETHIGSPIPSQLPPDTSWHYIPAQVIFQSWYTENLYFILNKGRRSGIRSHAGVLTPQGVLGVITDVSEDYSVGLPLFHPDLRITIQVEDGTLGLAHWEEGSLNQIQVDYIPLYASLTVGSDIVTAASSTYFPPFLYVGKIISLQKNLHTGFHSIKARTYADWNRIHEVYVVQRKTPIPWLDGG